MKCLTSNSPPAPSGAFLFWAGRRGRGAQFFHYTTPTAFCQVFFAKKTFLFFFLKMLDFVCGLWYYNSARGRDSKKPLKKKNKKKFKKPLDKATKVCYNKDKIKQSKVATRKKGN